MYHLLFGLTSLDKPTDVREPEETCSSLAWQSQENFSWLFFFFYLPIDQISIKTNPVQKYIIKPEKIRSIKTKARTVVIKKIALSCSGEWAAQYESGTQYWVEVPEIEKYRKMC